MLRRAPGVLVATGKPFEYAHTKWGESVHMIGPAVVRATFATLVPSGSTTSSLPIVLVTTSSVRQADGALVNAPSRALDGEPVHVVATHPAGSHRMLIHGALVTRH